MDSDQCKNVYRGPGDDQGGGMTTLSVVVLFV